MKFFISKISMVMILSSLSSQLYAAKWKKIIPVINIPNISAADCPPNYLPIKKMHPYTYRNFCIMKYEAKVNAANGTSTSQASGVPYGSLSRFNAKASCKNQGTGYDLISNEQWQTVAKLIADTKENWSSGTLYVGQLNTGHSDNSPSSLLAASTDDNDSCFGTGQTCDLSTWNSQRRTHRLPDGNIIWDFAGNAWEWVNNNYLNVYGGAYVSNFTNGSKQQSTFGAYRVCDNPSSAPYCGFGWGGSSAVTGSAIRGGVYNTTQIYDSGVFAADFYFREDYAGPQFGFRCVYVP